MSSEEITTDPEKLKAMQQWLTQRDRHEVMSFLGLCAYYRQFISPVLPTL
jgi:hypothetical protein